MKKLLLILLCFAIFSSGCITTKLYKTVRRCETKECIRMNFGPPARIEKYYAGTATDYGKVYQGRKAPDRNPFNIGGLYEVWIYDGTPSAFGPQINVTMNIYISSDMRNGEEEISIRGREVSNSDKYHYGYSILAWSGVSFLSITALILLL